MDNSTNTVEPEVTEQEVKAERLTGIARLLFPLVFIVLVALIAIGVLDAEALSAAVAAVLAVAGLVLAWWKDNNMTIMAIVRHVIWNEEAE